MLEFLARSLLVGEKVREQKLSQGRPPGLITPHYRGPDLHTIARRMARTYRFARFQEFFSTTYPRPRSPATLRRATNRIITRVSGCQSFIFIGPVKSNDDCARRLCPRYDTAIIIYCGVMIYRRVRRPFDRVLNQSCIMRSPFCSLLLISSLSFSDAQWDCYVGFYVVIIGNTPSVSVDTDRRHRDIPYGCLLTGPRGTIPYFSTLSLRRKRTPRVITHSFTSEPRAAGQTPISRLILVSGNVSGSHRDLTSNGLNHRS